MSATASTMCRSNAELSPNQPVSRVGRTVPRIIIGTKKEPLHHTESNHAKAQTGIQQTYIEH
jgi:hypothetical protein